MALTESTHLRLPWVAGHSSAVSAFIGPNGAERSAPVLGTSAAASATVAHKSRGRRALSKSSSGPPEDFPLAELGGLHDFDECFFVRARALVRVVG
ncbi:hypothetical protein MTO96_008484 [Rhipicephalus appendiculatus]